MNKGCRPILFMMHYHKLKNVMQSKINCIEAKGTRKPDQYLVNELFHAGYDIDYIVENFPISEEEVITAINGTAMNLETCILSDLLNPGKITDWNEYDASYQDFVPTKRDIQRSIESLPNSEARMKLNGYYEDRFIWDGYNKGELKAQNSEEREYHLLTYEQHTEMVISYEEIMGRMTGNCKRTINSSTSISKEDALQDLMLEKLTKGVDISKTGMIYRITRETKKR